MRVAWTLLGDGPADVAGIEAAEAVTEAEAEANAAAEAEATRREADDAFWRARHAHLVAWNLATRAAAWESRAAAIPDEEVVAQAEADEVVIAQAEALRAASEEALAAAENLAVAAAEAAASAAAAAAVVLDLAFVLQRGP